MRSRPLESLPIIGDEALLEEYKEPLNKLEDGVCNTKNFKKMRGHYPPLYRWRFNDSDRLLLAPVTYQGEQYLLLVGAVPNHDYKKPVILKDKHALQAYIDKQAANFPQMIKRHREKAEQGLRVEGSWSSIQSSSKLYFNHQVIHLNEPQEASLQKQLPLIVTGSPGSGKTCVAFAMLMQAVEDALAIPGADDKLIFIYMAHSDYLVQKMQAMWESTPLSKALGGPRVLFRTVSQQLARKGKTVIAQPKEHFTSWISEHFTTPHGREWLSLFSQREEALALNDELYQEFRVLSGFDPLEDYFKAGRKESLFVERSKREWIVQAYSLYLAHLKQEKTLHPAFHPFNKAHQGAYDKVFLDEGQYCSGLQLKSACLLAKDGQICISMDLQQSLEDSLSKDNFIHSQLPLTGEVNHVHLPYSYRCAKTITHLANRWLDIKYLLTGGLGDKNEQSSIQSDPDSESEEGKVTWLDELSPEQIEVMKDWAKSPNFVVITHECFRDEVKAFFNGMVTILTSEDAMGSEFEKVLLYRIFEEPPQRRKGSKQKVFLHKEADKKVGANFASLGKETINRPKAGAGDTKFKTFASLRFTAITRAKLELVIYQPSKELSHIRAYLEKDLQPKQELEKSQVIDDADTLKEKWNQLACELAAQGLTEQAKQIRETKLGEKQSPENGPRAVIPKGDEKRQSFHSRRRKNKGALKAEKPVPSAKKPVAQEKKPPTKANQSEAKSEDKDVLYAKNLFLNFTEKNLENSLYKTRDVKRRQKILFESPLFFEDYDAAGQGENLLFHIVMDPKKYQIFATYLDAHPEAVKELTADLLIRKNLGKTGFSSLFHLLTSVENRLDQQSILEILDRNDPDFLSNKIPPEIICGDGRVSPPPPLYFLARYKKGLLLLERLITNEQLVAYISREDLFFKPQNEVIYSFEKLINKKLEIVFCLLAQSLKGHCILATLFKNNLPLAKEISHNDLMTMDLGGEPILSLLVQLFHSTSNAALHALLSNSNELRMQISIAGLRIIYDQYSVLDKLAQTIDNENSVLCLLLNENQRLKQQFTHPDLFSSEGKKFPSFIFFAVSPKRQGILTDILAENALLARTICAADLSYQDDLKHLPALNWFALMENAPVLRTLVNTEDSTFAQGLSVDQLYQLITFKNEYENTSCFLFLTESLEKIKILKAFLDCNPNLTQNVPNRSLDARRSQTIGIYENITALYQLAMHKIGLEILKTLLRNNEQLEVSADDLCRIVRYGKTVSQNPSPMFVLLRTPEGCEVLQELIIRDDYNIAKTLTVAHLCECYSQIGYSQYQNSSALAMLMSSKERRVVLKIIFEQNPSLAKSIPLSAWEIKWGMGGDRSPLKDLADWIDDFNDLVNEEVLRAAEELNNKALSTPVSANRYGFLRASNNEVAGKDLSLAKNNL